MMTAGEVLSAGAGAVCGVPLSNSMCLRFFVLCQLIVTTSSSKPRDSSFEIRASHGGLNSRA